MNTEKIKLCQYILKAVNWTRSVYYFEDICTKAYGNQQFQ